MANRHWVTGGNGVWSSSTNWSTTSGGASGAAAPTNSDNVYLDGNSGAGTVATTSGAICGGLDCTGADGGGAFTGTLDLNTNGLTIKGFMTLAAGQAPITGSAAVTFTLTGAQNCTFAGQTLPAMAMNGSGGTLTLQDTMRVSGVFTLTLGTFDANGQAVNVGSFSSSNSNTRTLKMGGGAWHLTSTGTVTVWLIQNATGLAFTPASSVVTITDAGAGTKTVNHVHATSIAELDWTAAGTGTLKLDPGANSSTLKIGSLVVSGGGKTLQFGVATTGRAYTIATVNLQGDNAGSRLSVRSTSSGTLTGQVGWGTRAAANYLDVKDQLWNNAAKFYAGGGSLNSGNNTGWSFGVDVGTPAEADTPQAVTAQGQVAVGSPTETDIARAVTAQGQVAAGFGAETDTAQAVRAQKRITIGSTSFGVTSQLPAQETDTAQAVRAQGQVAVGGPAETDVAEPVTPQGQVTIGFGAEADVAEPVAATKRSVLRTGWGIDAWGSSPWGGVEPPFLPGGHPVIGRDEFPEALPQLEHKIVGPNGQIDYPTVVAGFSADEDVGFATLSGTVESERVRDQPELYTDGAQWIVSDSSTGEIVAAGDLLSPAIGGGAAALKADGWAKRLARGGERLMYATRGYASLFVPKNSEPYGPSGRGYYAPGSDKFQVDATGALRWKMNKGTDGWDAGPPPDQHGFIASFIGLRPGVRRVTGHIHSTVDGVNFRAKVYTTDSVEGLFGAGVELADFTSGGTDADFDVATDPVDPVLIIQVERTTSGSTTQDIELTINDLVLYGIASDDRWSASDVGRDIAGRLGFATRIQESVFNVLPLDAGADGVYQDPLDIACLLSGMFYRVLGTAPGQPLLEMRRQGSVLWELVDPEFPIEPIPLPRYDSVLIPYTLSNGVAQDVLEVTAASINRAPLPISRSYGPVPLPDPLPNADNARLLGQQILTLVYPERFAGRATFSRVHGAGGFATAHDVHAQDVLALPLNGGTVLPIKSLHREGGFAEATFDDGIAAVDRLLARKARQVLLKNPR